MKSIIAMSVFCVDLYNSTGEIRVGGNSLNFAAQCLKSKAGHVSVLGCVGNDRYGEFIKDSLVNMGLPLNHIVTAQGKTASNKIFIGADGEPYFAANSWDGGVYQSFRLSKEEWDFVRSHDVIAMTSFDPNFMTALKEKLPCNALVVNFLDSREYDRISEILNHTAIGFISGNFETVERLAPISKQSDTLIVVTMGGKGSVVIKNGKTFFSPAFRIKNIVDTLGCGDAYQAAFTVSWFAHHNIETAMLEGTVAATKILKHLNSF